MELFSAIIIVIGLFIFESVASIDNAIINADILSTMGEKAKKWFLLWGILLSVFLVRGLLPWVILWAANPSLGPIGALTATINDDSAAIAAMESTAPYLLMFGGVFMLFLFCHWLFAEKKDCIVPGERFLTSQGPWFYAVVSVILLAIVWTTLQFDPMLSFAAVGGSTLFFIVQGFRLAADKKSAELGHSEKSDLAKLMMLLVVDCTFSIDGVIGAFAFTFSVPLIFIGCGLGAIVVRELTVKYIDVIKKFTYLKNGAMYSVLMLAVVMVAEGFHIDIPSWITTVGMLIIVGVFLLLSIRKNKKGQVPTCNI